MLITNNTTQDYWFGPLHIPASAVGFSVDDTTATSLYLTDDDVADAINYLKETGKITVTSAAAPFPRPTGSPAQLSGKGSPEGLVFAPQGSLYQRQDVALLYTKTTGKTLDTGWRPQRVDRAAIKREALKYTDEAFALAAAGQLLPFTSGDCRATSLGLAAGDVVSSLTFIVGAAIQTITMLKLGLFDASGNLLVASANSTPDKVANTPVTLALTTPYTVPADGLFYGGLVIVATTIGSVVAAPAAAGKSESINGGPKSALVKGAQSDIPANLGTTSTSSPIWLGWS